MTIQFDEKGKFFTDIITKVALSARVQLIHGHVEGQIHVRQGERVKDALDQVGQFLAMTDAKIYDPHGALSAESAFLAVNVAHILWVIPEEEDSPTGE